jgi:hypothetical protein
MYYDIMECSKNGRRQFGDGIRLIEQRANNKVIPDKYRHEPNSADTQPGHILFIPDTLRKYPKYVAIEKYRQENQDNIYVGYNGRFSNPFSDNMGVPGPYVNVRAV